MDTDNLEIGQVTDDDGYRTWKTLGSLVLGIIWRDFEFLVNFFFGKDKKNDPPRNCSINVGICQ